MSETPQTTDFDSKEFLKHLTHKPGVYRMLDEHGQVLYVGKARNLKKRVSSYFRQSGLAPKTQALMQKTHSVEVTITHTETEALILESNLIKELRPRYNILLRDDKSYPYIFLSTEHEFPRLTFHRGAKREKGRYFGPYPSTGAVRETLSLLQKLFPVRQCQDSFYRNRSRPCLQYQIKRCTAPCVGLISAEDYAQDVKHAILFLEGRNDKVVQDLVSKMEQAAEKLDYELAARYRDQIAGLRRLQERQYVSSSGGDLDVIACVLQGGEACVEVFFIRGGRNLGNKAFFPKLPKDTDEGEVLAAFLPQYYLEKYTPGELLVSHEIEDKALVAEALAGDSGRRIQINRPVRGDKKRWIKMALENATIALTARQASKMGMQRRLEALQDALGLDQLPTRMECFDISHTMGEATVASCVVFDSNGPLKSDYRRFNIEGITGGDDYAAMHQALERRYTRLKKGEGKLPDILFIDGGKGQIRQASDVLEELQIDGVTIVGVAKGEGRRPGLETLFLSGQSQPIILPEDAAALHLVQQIRDEAHRFAITGHRQRRAKQRKTSTLESIHGLGPKRRQTLLKQFGGMQEIARAGVDDLVRAPGISKELALKIYDAFHPDKT